MCRLECLGLLRLDPLVRTDIDGPRRAVCVAREVVRGISTFSLTTVPMCSQNGCEAIPTFSEAKSRSARLSRSSHDSKPTCHPAVAQYQLTK
ncbi:hypothetical protein SAMN05216268_116245 [Streptomyces yunnanensis]|uniref:Uncharacterized protein n=1 Tax=Streptomyces yunnanensis TaxID=156453 RepID=A0A9X8N4P5_9ACTN|nr:hypothetical protein SAMN05216268_116245 [Streptomyces yunnanensis]